MNILPSEIVHRILEYDGRIKHRHGKYMNQITPDDVRYEMLKQMPQIQTFPNYIQSPYMSVYSRNKIYCEKKQLMPPYTASYYGEKTNLICTYKDTTMVSYSFINQGFYYEFIIYKTPPPSLCSYITKYFYDLCAVNSYKYLVI